MAEILITPELLDEKAGEVRRLRGEHDETMRNLSSLIHALNESWKGEAQDALVAQYDGMQQTFTQFSEVLENYAKLMDTTAREMRNTDITLKNTINSSFG